MDISEHEEYERLKAESVLMGELEKGRISGEEDGWLSAEQVREHFGKCRNSMLYLLTNRITATEKLRSA